MSWGSLLKGLGGAVASGAIVGLIMHAVQGRPVAMPSPTQSHYASAGCSKHYSARLSAVDDFATLRINGQLVAEARWGRHGAQRQDWKSIGHKPGDSGWVALNTYLVSGENLVEIQLWNNKGCCSTRLTAIVKEEDDVIFERKLDRRDSTEGVKMQESLTIEMPPCSTPGA